MWRVGKDLGFMRNLCPDRCGSVVWASFCKAKVRRFYSRSGHMPGQGTYKRQLINVSLSHQYFSLSFVPPFLSLCKGRKGKRKERKKIFVKKKGICVVRAWTQAPSFVGQQHHPARAWGSRACRHQHGTSAGWGRGCLREGSRLLCT